VRILVIDDTRAVRARFAAMLSELAGVERILEAKDNVEGLALAVQHAPRVVVLDLHLGPHLAIDLIPYFASRAPRPLVVVVTSEPSEGHRRTCIASGADHFFDKSREFDRVLEVVEAVLAAP
jgi:DNA-binding NarL/FixJ family response regulator